MIRNIFWSLTLVSTLLGQPGVALAEVSAPKAADKAAPPADQTKKPESESSGGPLTITVDSPNFRKLVSAAPVFLLDKTLSKDAQEFAKSGPAELERLLDFSGLFNILSEDAYKDLMGKVSEELKKQRAEVVLGSANKQGFEGIDLAQWKAIGVESLTIGELTEEDGGLTLAIRTLDITRGTMLVGKRYRKITKAESTAVIRRYADLVLEAYTGKPGIFSTKVTFVGRKTKGSEKQVYVADFDGSNVVQITSEKAVHVSPQWSPDGRFITYTSFESGNPDLYIYELATGKKRKLSGQPGLNSGSNWAPNGKIVAYTGSKDGDTDLFMIRPDGTGRKLLIKGEGLDVDPAFSPDKKWMAFVSGRFGNPHVFVATLKWDGEENVSVTGDKRLTYAGWYNATPAWSPESDKIAFAGYDKDINRFDIFIMNPDGSEMERLTLKSGNNESPSWAPNGQLIMFESNRIGNKDIKGPSHLYIMSRDGSGQRKLETGLYESQTPRWSPIIQ